MTATAMKGKQIGLEYAYKVGDNDWEPPRQVTYTHGSNQVIRGIESAVEGMAVGETKQVVVAPTEGFGERDPKAIREVNKQELPNDIRVGTQLRLKDNAGRDLLPSVIEIKDHTALLDFNHPLAGKTVLYDLKVVTVD